MVEQKLRQSVAGEQTLLLSPSAGAVLLDVELCIASLHQTTVDTDFGFNFRTTINLSAYTQVGFTIDLSSASLVIYIDRRQSGVVNFDQAFPSLQQYSVPIARLQAVNGTEWCARVVLDRSSVELYVQHGLAVMTAAVFPTPNIDNEGLMWSPWLAAGEVNVTRLSVWPLKDGHASLAEREEGTEMQMQSPAAQYE